MRLEKIYLENFRNYTNTQATIDSDLVLIVGENAAGKTNLLESIYFMSALKSFRAPDPMLINHGKDHLTIKIGYGDEELEAVVQGTPVLRRGYKVNGQKIKRIAWNAYQTVLFVPGDLNMFILGPDARRKFLNEVLSEKETLYTFDLTALEHVLKQRGALLENIREGRAGVAELEFWDNELAGLALRISTTRRNFIEYLNDLFNETYNVLTGFSSQFFVSYKGLDATVNEKRFLEMLFDHRDAEIRTGMNLVGPHRDDFIILKDGLQNIYNSSRGELREQILTMKMLQARYVTTGESRPLLLLDDVFSELDSARRLRLLTNLMGYQIFITSTEHFDLPNTQTIRVADNQLTR